MNTLVLQVRQFKTKEDADTFNRLITLNDGHVYYMRGYWWCEYYRS